MYIVIMLKGHTFSNGFIYHYRLTAGLGNILLQYISLFPGRGVMLCPAHKRTTHPIQVKYFRKVCFLVRAVLRRQLNEEVSCEDTDSDKENGKVFSTSRPKSYIEHGVLFRSIPCSPEKLSHQSHQSSTYWVVG